MTEKQFINPYKLFSGSFIPNWLLKRPELSHGAKLCYARLCQFAGSKGMCYPKQNTLATEIGVSERQVRTYISELMKHALLEKKKSGKKNLNQYVFPLHDWMDVNRQDSSALPLNRQDSSCLNRKDSSSFIRRESVEVKKHIRDISKKPSSKKEADALKEEVFEEFWKLYPRRKGKKLKKAAAKRKFMNLKRADHDPILQAARHYAMSQTATDGYAMDAVRFLNDDNWQDWIKPETPQKDNKDYPIDSAGRRLQVL